MVLTCNICKQVMSPGSDDLYFCSACGLVSSDLKPDIPLYDKSYAMKYERYDRTDISSDINRCRYNVVKKHIESGNVLDFGCGAGAFVRECNKNGLSGTGFDINPYGKFCDVTNLLSHYDIVTFWDSLEHVQDPKSLIMKLGAEYIFVCTPDTDDHEEDLVQWHHYYPGEHIHYFNEKSLRALFASCGYNVIEVNHDESCFRTSGGEKNIITVGGRKWER